MNSTVSDIHGDHNDTKRLLISFLYPAAFVIFMWMVKITELLLDVRFVNLGIFPLSINGLPGIIFSPFIHADFAHLISNSLPFLVLGAMLFYFYRKIAFAVLVLSVLITGFWVWVFARDAWHIGASGVVYSLAAFLFVSGFIRKHPRLMAISFIVTFLYGGMVWGILPLREHISWESHLMGLLSGVLLAVFFREKGPRRKLYSWEIEEMQEQEELQKQKEARQDYKPGSFSPEEIVLKEPFSINKDGHPEDNTLERIMKISYSYKPKPDSEDNTSEDTDTGK